VTAPCVEPELAAATAEGRGGTYVAAAGLGIQAIAKTREQAVVGKAADSAADAILELAQQCKRIAFLQAERRVQRGVAKAETGAGFGVFGGFKDQIGLELAAGVIPDRK